MYQKPSFCKFGGAKEGENVCDMQRAAGSKARMIYFR